MTIVSEGSGWPWKRTRNDPEQRSLIEGKPQLRWDENGSESSELESNVGRKADG